MQGYVQSCFKVCYRKSICSIFTCKFGNVAQRSHISAIEDFHRSQSGPGSRKLVSTPDTYYSSQSGRVMRVPGSAGTRIHETCAFEWRTVSSRLDLLQQLCSASFDTVELWPGAAAELKAFGGWKSVSPKFTSRIENFKEMEDVLKYPDLISFVDVYVPCDGFEQKLKLVSEAKANDLRVRAYVCNAFEMPDGSGTDPAVVQDTVVALADADASSIIITDDMEKADDDSLRYFFVRNIEIECYRRF